MEITGKIIWAGERKGGVSASSGQQWASQDFVVQNISTDYSGRQVTTNICFNVFGVERLNQWQPRVGEDVTVGYGISAHEHNGRWYNEVRAFKYERIGVHQYAQQAQPQAQPQQYQQPYQQQYAQQSAAANYGQQTQQPFPPNVDPSTGLPF